MSLESKSRGEELKGEGNQAFKDKHYALAQQFYSKALEIDHANAMLWGNRAFAAIRLEEFGGAIADASKAIELDPKYAKAYYRRGDASYALGHWKDAVRDFRSAIRLAPSDPDLRRKLAEAEKEMKRQAFEKALATPDEKPYSEQVVLEDMFVEEGYSGPRMEADEEGRLRVTLEFVQGMLEAFKNEQLVHRRYAFEIILQAQAILKALPALVDVTIPDGGELTVCGDTHGQFFDLLRIFDLNGLPSDTNPYLFNGDFVDRGSWSVEIILTLLVFKCLYPQHMHLTRGNHEAKSMNTIYGFVGEVKAKYTAQMAEVFRETFCWLPLGFVINDKVLVVHGGPPVACNATLADVRKLDRNREPPEDGPMCEMLWNDPQDQLGMVPNKRGVGVAFGPDVAKRWLESQGLQMVVRSHEVKDEGFEVAHDGYTVTIFSAPNYCDQMGNKGAFIRFDSDCKPSFTQFDAAPHPNKRPMAYAAGAWSSMM
ncbi:Serine threonine-phosphatase 5 [Micractinium conductrix]|uniref:protein-serine/threonine phosphatase n=1 Tax=Micractinium conductrix TaxID=554055 RepID=A0A2P6VNU8_9CHLO|nr:Serine threonine-phosphatase 5 [Micractinium conductrix]|eukprot:PSC75771.1 Serine threonine-phosphatase 5 [Micractinium conductrix]